MVDRISKETRSRIMAAIRSQNTKAEVMLRRVLWAKGLRFRKYYCEEKIDIAFPSRKLAVFVDGCFWHACPEHFKAPRTHRDYWERKIKRNMERDKAKNERLQASGWRVMRFWEHELRTISEVSRKIQLTFEERRVITHKTSLRKRNPKMEPALKQEF